MTKKEKAVALMDELLRTGALSQEHYDTLLAGFEAETETRAETPFGTIVVKKAVDDEHLASTSTCACLAVTASRRGCRTPRWPSLSSRRMIGVCRMAMPALSPGFGKISRMRTPPSTSSTKG